MAKTIEQLRKEIAEQRRIVSREQKESAISSKMITEKNKLSRQLFELKNRKLIAAGERTKKGLVIAGRKAKRLSGRFGRGILKAGQKIAPVIQKQVKLIQQQQLRDDAIAKERSKRNRIITPTRIKKRKKLKFRKVKVKIKKPKRKQKVQASQETIQESQGIFGNLDF